MFHKLSLNTGFTRRHFAVFRNKKRNSHRGCMNNKELSPTGQKLSDVDSLEWRRAAEDTFSDIRRAISTKTELSHRCEYSRKLMPLSDPSTSSPAITELHDVLTISETFKT